RVEVHRHIDLFRRQDLGRYPAWNDRLEGAAAADSLGVALDQIAERDPHGHFIESGPGHVATYREKPGAALFRSSQRREAIGSFAQDEWHTGQRFDVVHDRGTLKQA